MQRLLSILLCFLILVCALPAQAEPAAMTRDAVLDLVKPAVGHGYFWGHNTWTSDGSNKGTCSGDCPTCTFKGTVGTDCSGLVSKAWQIPSALQITTYATYITTDVFRFQELYWKRIQRSELMPGDALVYRNTTTKAGHIVLFDRMGDVPGRYWVYEARGCQFGVVHNQRVFSGDYIAIRRNALLETATNAAQCGSHGHTDPANSCSCDPGYSGASCDQCASGYYGYPACVREGSACEPSGSIQCGDTINVDGPQQIYAFRPSGRSKAQLTLNGSSAGLQLNVLKQQCDAKSRVGAAASSLAIDYSEGDVFYVSAESVQGSLAEGQLSVQCETPKQAWIGDACASDLDCDLSHQPEAGNRGFCLKQGSAAFCSLPCTSLCPDLLPDKAQTFCVQSANDNPSGVCVSRSDRQNAQCTSIPGTIELLSERRQQSDVKQLACVPTSATCTGIFTGRVVEFDTLPGRAVVGASVHVTAGTFTTDATTDELGNYTVPGVPCVSLTLNIGAPGFLTEHLSLASDGNQQHFSQLRALPLACSGEGSITGIVSDAVLNQPVAGARIELFPSLGRAEGTPVAGITGSSAGTYEFTHLNAGHYTARIEAAGYAPLEEEVVVCGQRTLQNDFFVSRASEAALRFVLSWQHPDDLDLHLQLPNGEEVYFDDLCHGASQSFPYATLDVDHQLADGPESISISALIPGRYTLFVHNYSRDFAPNQPGFQDSQAQVSVFGNGGSLLGRFPVPIRGSGLYWDVLSFEGLHPEKLIPIQALSSERLRPENYVQACRP